MSDSTSITLPQSVPFPVTVTSILCTVGEVVPKHKTILKYKYWDYQDDPNSKDETPPKIRVERIGTFESPIEGEVQRINISVQEEIPHSGIELCSIKEPCLHTVQYGGLCALCGKAVEDEKDYSGYTYEDRATISMSYDNTGLKISLDEAAKIEQNSTDRLTKEKKLILVVDLDQTVIHATVDPTVGEWQQDPTNPNYPAVKDVKTFVLEEEPLVPPGWTGPKLAPTKCWYYVKVRPGLSEFLQEVSKLYELHIYTMATRNYALAIANIIDPDGKYFGDRILSRDESGSLTHKNLKRLFPVDQSMVAIIDDRGDVWQWESNLIKVVPYDFFVGIGDINSSFLPKKNGQLTGPTKKRKSIAILEAEQEKIIYEEINNGVSPKETVSGSTNNNEIDNNNNNNNNKDIENNEEIDAINVDDDIPIDEEIENPSPVERMLELGGGEGNTSLLMEQSLTRSHSIEQQQQDRPLAKLQHTLEKMHHHDHDIHSRSSSPDGSSGEEEDEDEEEEDNLLYDDDNELLSLKKVLVNIHDEYYRLFEQQKSIEIVDESNKPSLTKIIPSMKSSCLKGITILFSGIIPLGINIESADIVIWCKQFGVNVVNEVIPEVTHVVSRDPATGQGPTFKTRVANKILPNVKIVNPDWLFDCLSSWEKVNEDDYLISTADEKQWTVKSGDIEKYQAAIARQRQKLSNKAIAEQERPRFDSISSLEDYDLEDARQEVEDFLAGISDDDDDDDEDDDEDEDEEVGKSTDISTNGTGSKQKKKEKDEEDEEEEEEEVSKSGGSSFIQGLYKSKKRQLEKPEEFDDDDEAGNDTRGGDSDYDRTNGDTSFKKQKIDETFEAGHESKEEEEQDLDELEKELLDGFDDLEE
ncbi:uncharacterized protein RJT21DRAFT_118154 [Scheffersomyces amazonensis]|uniref:uncharacterized protein n=1 Tax=Scheffersomyces amazonensis TaxID=1078765 RepID=UPI00315D9A15